jgi:hypothetical protein
MPMNHNQANGTYQPIRGINPESNQNLLTDQAALEEKKEKIVEIFKNSS